MLKPKELRLLQDPEILLTKNKALATVEQLMLACLPGLSFVSQPNILLPKYTHPAPKLSRGEQYQQLPYRVLDYPRYFKQDDIFAGRIIFLWGDSFSVQFLLSGHSWQAYTPPLIDSTAKLAANDWYTSLNPDPWQHKFAPDNYQLLSKIAIDPVQLARRPFAKFARRLPITDYNYLQQFTSESYAQFLSALSVSA